MKEEMDKNKDLVNKIKEEIMNKNEDLLEIN